MAEHRDAALDALDTLSEVTESAIERLGDVNEGLEAAARRRRHGWPWRRVVASVAVTGSMAAVTDAASDLGRANSSFRGALVRALRGEGMKMTEIAGLLDVSRQRVGALLHRPLQYPAAPAADALSSEQEGVED